MAIQSSHNGHLGLVLPLGNLLGFVCRSGLCISPSQPKNQHQTNERRMVKLSCPAVGTNWQPHPGTLAVWRPTMLEVMSFYSRTKQSTLFIKPPNSAEGGFNHERLLHPPPSSPLPSRLHPLALRHLLWEAVLFLTCPPEANPKEKLKSK